MLNYFKRLLNHPGFYTAIFMMIMLTLAGLDTGRKANEILGFVFGVLVWIPVLITNRKQK